MIQSPYDLNHHTFVQLRYTRNAISLEVADDMLDSVFDRLGEDFKIVVCERLPYSCPAAFRVVAVKQ